MGISYRIETTLCILLGVYNNFPPHHFTSHEYFSTRKHTEYSLMNIIMNSSLFKKHISFYIVLQHYLKTLCMSKIKKETNSNRSPRSSSTIKLAIFTNPENFKAASEAPLTNIARNISILYTSWWLNQNPSEKICSSKWESNLPQGSGWKFQKYLSCHHPVDHCENVVLSGTDHVWLLEDS